MDQPAGDDDDHILTSPAPEAQEDAAHLVDQPVSQSADQSVPVQPDDRVEAEGLDAIINAPMTGREEKRLAALIYRVEVLTEAIERYPDAPVNYVLRGEMLLDGGDIALAADDFQKALELAEYYAESANWGYIYRALADRAQKGLKACREATNT
jgi:hypothetical protein